MLAIRLSSNILSAFGPTGLEISRGKEKLIGTFMYSPSFYNKDQLSLCLKTSDPEFLGQ